MLLWAVLALLPLAHEPGPPGRPDPPPPPPVRVTLDATLAEQALAYLATGREALLAEMGATDAAAHLLRHARTYEYDVPRDSAAALARSLVTPADAKQAGVPGARKALAYFSGPLRDDPSWAAEVGRTLPADAPVPVTLFLTFGYDIGVACPGTASLNAAHPHFDAHPRELRYYAIHECHHAVFMTYRRPRPVAEWRTAADLLAQAEYALQLEGTAVWAAYACRAREGALDWDDDYRALGDDGRIHALRAKYLAVHSALAARAGEGGPADAATRALFETLYDRERVFYRFGAHAARTIERARGAAALADLVKAGPRAFLETYLALEPGGGAAVPAASASPPGAR